MLCPLCKQPLDRETVELQTVDRCSSCLGIWFDESELSQVVRRLANPTSIGMNAKRELTELACPKCNSAMTLFNYAHDSGIFVNKCHSCVGVWIEHGQLEQIAQYRIGTPAVQALGNAIAAEMRASNRWQRLRKLSRSRLLSSVIAMAYLSVAVTVGSGFLFMTVLFWLVLPMACIWFGDQMGQYRGYYIGYGVTRRTPGDFVVGGGWIMLFCTLFVIQIALARA